MDGALSFSVATIEYFLRVVEKLDKHQENPNYLMGLI